MHFSSRSIASAALLSSFNLLGGRKTYVGQAYLQAFVTELHMRMPTLRPSGRGGQDVTATTCDKARALAPETLRIWQDLPLGSYRPNRDITVIDLGCGTGRFPELLAEHHGVQVAALTGGRRIHQHWCSEERRGTIPSIGASKRTLAKENFSVV